MILSRRGGSPMNAPVCQPTDPAALLYQRAAVGKTPPVMTAINDDQINIAIWQRQLPPSLAQAALELLRTRPGLQINETVTPATVATIMSHQLSRSPDAALFGADIAGLVERFCVINHCHQVQAKLTALDQTMCPKFHVDWLSCRLVTTYHGAGTEWLPDSVADRRKLGLGSGGQPDHLSGLYVDAADIQQLAVGDVALLKGDLWEGNAGAGLIHRSPAVPAGHQRLLLVLDVVRDHRS